MSGTELALNSTQRMDPDSWHMITEQATTLEAAGKGTSILPKGITNRYQIAAILQKGWELGFPPMYSLEQIALVNGKPIVQGQALLAIIQRAHGGKAVSLVESTDERACFRFKRADEDESHELEWTWEMAENAELAGKSTWKQYPRTMLRWRCIAEGARLFFADTIAGLYLPDEMGVQSTVDATGNLIISQESHESTTTASGEWTPADNPGQMSVTVEEETPVTKLGNTVLIGNATRSVPAEEADDVDEGQIVNAASDPTNLFGEKQAPPQEESPSQLRDRLDARIEEYAALKNKTTTAVIKSIKEKNGNPAVLSDLAPQVLMRILDELEEAIDKDKAQIAGARS